LRIINNYFTEKDSDVEYIPADQIEVAIRNMFGSKEINELIVQEEELLKKKVGLLKSRKIKETVNRIKSKIQLVQQEPRFPYKEGPREYQETAFTSWKNNNQQGLFAMATGTGKTITSLNCLLQIYKKTGYYKALILVPTITLVNQWEEECKKFNFNSIVKVFSKSKSWKNDLAGILLQEKINSTEPVSFVVISTYASFSKRNIFSELNQLPPKTLLIADECHNMGSRSLLKYLPKVRCKRRIGLSATPARQFDAEGNKKLLEFFNSANGYTYEYSMEEAIKKGVLCRYYYYPHLISLTKSEMSGYLKISLRIAKYFNPKTGGLDWNDPILTALLLARKRIIHKAFNKVSVFRSILDEHYSKKGQLKYSLIYVPEGNDPSDYFETDLYSIKDETGTDADAVHLIDVFTKTVKDIDPRTTVRKFISGTSERDDILAQFASGEIDVLTSMKCLDEGVDVPRAELAIFCASTGNPRQFVQRRGRILRNHKDKQFAYIHDLVVIPEVSKNSDSFDVERSMLKKELERVYNFASLSENSSFTVNVLLDTMNYYNLNLYHNE
jgi:superfamily II DNA or RNA helicase